MRVRWKRLLAVVVPVVVVLALALGELPASGEPGHERAAVNLGCSVSLAISPSSAGTFSTATNPTIVTLSVSGGLDAGTQVFLAIYDANGRSAGLIPLDSGTITASGSYQSRAELPAGGVAGGSDQIVVADYGPTCASAPFTINPLVSVSPNRGAYLSFSSSGFHAGATVSITFVDAHGTSFALGSVAASYLGVASGVAIPIPAGAASGQGTLTFDDGQGGVAANLPFVFIPTGAPTPTSTSTPLPPTATNSATRTATGTATSTITPGGPTFTNTPTATSTPNCGSSGVCIGLTASAASVPVNTIVILTATTSTDVKPTIYYIIIVNEANAVLKACATGTTCSVGVNSSTAATHTYTAVLSQSSTSIVGSGGQSGPVGVTWTSGSNPSATLTGTPSTTNTPSATATATATQTATPSATNTPGGSTATGTNTSTATASSTATPTATPTVSTTATGTATSTSTPSATASSTLTGTATNTPIQGAGIVNGGFESGTLAGWTAAINQGGGNPEATAVVTAAQRHSGSFAALLGGAGTAEPSGDSCLYQDFATAGGTYSFFYLPFSSDVVNFDWQEAYLRPAGTAGCSESGTQLFKVASNARAWTQASRSLAAGSYQAYFNVHEDGAGDDTYLYLDDVSAPGGAAPSATVTSTATASTTPTATNTPGGATATSTNTSSPTNTPTATPTATNTPTATGTGTATPTSSPSATATATSSPTRTPTPGAGITNGGFESGTLAGWTAAINQGGGNREATAVVTAAQRHSGSFAALLGGAGTAEPSGDSCLYQDFATAGGAYSFFYLPFSSDVVNFDWQEAYLRPAGTAGCSETGTQLFKVASNARAWTQASRSLAAGSYQAYFNVHEDGAGDDTYLYLDDVGVQ